MAAFPLVNKLEQGKGFIVKIVVCTVFVVAGVYCVVGIVAI